MSVSRAMSVSFTDTCSKRHFETSPAASAWLAFFAQLHAHSGLVMLFHVFDDQPGIVNPGLSVDVCVIVLTSDADGTPGR
eukprot:1331270-Prymnesium_polylepis.2